MKMNLKDKILNKYSSRILGACISASCFYGSCNLDNKLVDEKKIYNIVPEVKRVLELEERLDDFKECSNIVENSDRLSAQLRDYTQEYETLMKKQEVIDSRVQIAQNKTIERNAFLLAMGGIYSFVLGFTLPYIYKKEKIN